MKAIWILPNREQCDDEDVVYSGSIDKLSNVEDVARLPRELTLGIPESLLRKHPGEQVVYAQFVRDRQQQKNYYAISVVAAKDKDGRTVYLTLLVILEPGEAPPQQLPLKGLPEAERSLAELLQDRLDNSSDRWTSTIREMWDAIERHRYRRTFANVTVDDALHVTMWTPEKKNNDVRRTRRVFVIALLGFATFCLAVWLLVRSCSDDEVTMQSEAMATLVQRGLWWCE